MSLHPARMTPEHETNRIIAELQEQGWLSPPERPEPARLEIPAHFVDPTRLPPHDRFPDWDATRQEGR